MFYIVGGCIYIMLFGVELAFRQIILDQNVYSPCFTNSTFYDEEDADMSPSDPVPTADVQMFPLNKDEQAGTLPPSPSMDSPENSTVFCDKADEAHLLLGMVVTKHAVRVTIFYAGFLCVGKLHFLKS